MAEPLPLPADWRKTLGAQDRAALDEAGYLHLPAVADADAVEAMRAAWARAMQAEPEFHRRGNNDGPGRLERDPAFAPCLHDPRVMAAVAHLLDGDVALLGFRGREPMAGSGQQGFHVDSATPVEPDRQMLVNAFWVLDDMDEANGATRIVPGSHRLRRVPGRDLLQPHARHPDAMTLKARAGDVIVFSAHLWHAGSKNQSGARRRIAMAHFGRQEAARAYAMGAEGAEA
jgi:ectoine hydroxylase-related dioxygenase (phytanoyl-CoA dioxygenase family)